MWDSAYNGCMAIDTTDDRDLFDFASFDDLPGRPVAREPEQDKQQRALAREVEAATYRAEHYGLN